MAGQMDRVVDRHAGERKGEAERQMCDGPEEKHSAPQGDQNAEAVRNGRDKEQSQRAKEHEKDGSNAQQ